MGVQMAAGDRRRSESRQMTALFAVLLAMGSVIPIWAAVQNHTYLNDDAYITLTYAQNLARGRGFVFNHSPPTLGTTTPLLTLIVAALARLAPWFELDVLAVFFTAFCWIVASWTIFVFRKSWGLLEWQAGLLGLVVLGTGWVAFLGMEAYLFAFLLILSLSLFYADRPFLSGLTTGLLFLTRGEGALIWVLLSALSVGSSWFRTRRLEMSTYRGALLLTAGFAIPASLWFLYAYITFGSLLPNTLAAKRAQGMADTANPFMVRLIEQWLPSWGRDFVLGYWPMVNLWWLLVALGILSAFLCRRKFLVLLAWILLYVTGYGLLRVSGYWWYQLPIHFAAQVFVGLGTIAVVDFVLARNWPHIVRIGIATALMAVVVIGANASVIRNASGFQGDPRGPSYKALSEWLRNNTEASESVAFIEIGYLGYYTENRIIDLAGLVMPEIVPHVADGDFGWGFWEYQPDYYLYSPAFDWVLAEIRSDARFDETYRAVVELPGPGDTKFTVFKKDSNDGD